ncbi:ferrous iron transport protein B [Leptospira selangorensis]|uniref:Ferrous iron transport protein B n=1 Tax=Leptospira selangorensis TaxID=2484982 RepID=A0A5F2C5N3_9LEPT|nr:ferrous iron transport protein B [Leptospira selangorensis]TGM13980.1 ferrous iron transport protein B [Leptospira selangorensis]TGM27088.1 ferrous iron transport protein B [Leptospira selangorensis]
MKLLNTEIQTPEHKTEKFRVLLTGNPNCGKSTLFNRLTGLRQKTGNYHGVTVEKAEGTIHTEESTVYIVDLPGAYSLGGESEDKQVTTRILLSKETEDKLIFVLDAVAIERGLQFLLQVSSLKIPMLVAVTMNDTLEKKGVHLDLKVLSKAFGVSFYFVNPRSGEGVEVLEKVLTDPSSYKIPDPNFSWDKKRTALIESVLSKLSADDPDSVRFVLENSFKEFSGENLQTGLPSSTFFPEKTREFIRSEWQKSKLEFSYGEELVQRSIWIKKLLSKAVSGSEISEKGILGFADKILLHPIWGLTIFLGIMALVFQFLFTWSEVPMDWIEGRIGDLADWTGNYLPEGPVRSLIQEGMIGGVGAVLVFIPQISLLFLFIGIMEESGYIARASFLMDRFMGRFGLSGKSFIPLLSSAACAVPAIMGTRTIENKADRLTTILVSPLITCSARYPVYILVIGTVFSAEPVFGIFSPKVLALFGLFLLGMFASMGAAFLFKKTFFRSEPAYFLMELPRYQWPSLKSLFFTVYKKIKAFIGNAGKVILFISIILWFLANYPRVEGPKNENLSPTQAKSLQISESYAGRMGKMMEPVLEPIGFGWKMGLGIITSFAAREVMVSTLSIVYGVQGEDSEDENLRSALRKDKDPETGKPVWTIASALSLLVFFAFACQCMSTLAVVRKETNSLFWPFFMFTYMTVLAYTSSFLVFHFSKFLGWN